MTICLNSKCTDENFEKYTYFLLSDKCRCIMHMLPFISFSTYIMTLIMQTINSTSYPKFVKLTITQTTNPNKPAMHIQNYLKKERQHTTCCSEVFEESSSSLSPISMSSDCIKMSTKLMTFLFGTDGFTDSMTGVAFWNIIPSFMPGATVRKSKKTGVRTLLDCCCKQYYQGWFIFHQKWKSFC